MFSSRRAFQRALTTVAQSGRQQGRSSSAFPWMVGSALAGTVFAASLLDSNAQAKEGSNATAAATSEQLDRLALSPADLSRIVHAFRGEMGKGLASDGCMFAMIPSFVDRLPTGTEKGTYYALDLGGTNFRVLSLTLPGDGTVASILTLPFRIPSIKCTAEELYGFIAGSITQFLKVYPPAAADASSVQLGFTFSFPCLQSSLNSATLIKWTKEFEVSGCVGQDPAKQLMKALDVQDGVEDGKLSVGGFNGFNLFHIAALCNDTVGTLMAKRYVDADCNIGLILGTGTNAAYVEDKAAISKLGAGSKQGGSMVVNMEWGNFRDESLKMTSYDHTIHANSSTTGQVFEKMISGKYLGEIARLAVLDAAAMGSYPTASESWLFKKDGDCDVGHLDAEIMGLVEQDTTPDLRHVGMVLETLEKAPPADADAANNAKAWIRKSRPFVVGQGSPSVTSLDERRHVQDLCKAVSTRAARLCAAGIAGICLQAGYKGNVTVAVDGSLFEKYPLFGDRVQQGLVDILGPGPASKVSLKLQPDGSGVGAAITAATMASA